MSRTVSSYRPPPPHRSATAQAVRVVGIIGRIFVGAGLLLLFYTAYLLWGTGVYTHGEQNKAKDSLHNAPIVADKEATSGHIPPAKPKHPLPLGSPLWTIKIPKIGVETVVVEGVGKEELKKGPGHFPSCAQISSRTDCVDQTVYPGEHGNIAISGHRTTYGAPFFNVQQLAQGDVIDIVSGRARYRYRVREQKIVDPVAGFSEVEQHGRDELTLTSCHPRFSASQRLIIKADYVGASLVTSAGAPGTPGSRPSTSHVITPEVLILASVALASGLSSLGLSKRYRAWAAYIALGLVGASVLWVGIFPRVLALMPSNY